MIRPLKSILLATNLQDYNKVAFDVAASMATHYQAKLVLLHVLEKMPINVESMLDGFMGEEQREEMQKAYSERIHHSLTGKSISSIEIRAALDDYCSRSGIDPEKCGILARETIVCEGDVAECILQTAGEKGCEMIIMAAHEGLITKTSISMVIKNVLRQASVPVLIVPNAFVKYKS